MSDKTVVFNKVLFCRKILQSVSVDVLGFYYKSKNDKNKNEDIICYYPEAESILYYNSFLPEMIVEITEEAFEVRLSIKSRFRKSVRLGLQIFYALLLIFQGILLISFPVNTADIGIALFIPIFIAVFFVCVVCCYKGNRDKHIHKEIKKTN